jgi:hypothetical protein
MTRLRGPAFLIVFGAFLPVAALADEAATLDAQAEVERADPNRSTFTDDARILPVGRIDLEAGYQLVFDALDLQSMEIVARYSPLARHEYRLGWYVFGLRESLGDESDAGVGDLFAEGKWSIDVDPIGYHKLAVLARVRPGIGQDPVSRDGLEVAGFAVYSVEPDPVRVDVQAGIDIFGITDDLNIYIPLSAAVRWSPIAPLDVFGEFVESLNLDDLSNSGTEFRAGVAWFPVPVVALDLAATVGLSEIVPDAGLRFGVSWLSPDVRR